MCRQAAVCATGQTYADWVQLYLPWEFSNHNNPLHSVTPAPSVHKGGERFNVAHTMHLNTGNRVSGTNFIVCTSVIRQRASLSCFVSLCNYICLTILALGICAHNVIQIVSLTSLTTNGWSQMGKVRHIPTINCAQFASSFALRKL